MYKGLASLILATLVAALAMLAMPEKAEAAELGAGMVGRELGICIRRVRPDDNLADLIRNPRGFDCTTSQRAFGPGDYWVVSGPIDQQSRSLQPLVVRFGSVYQQRLALSVLYGDGRITTMADDNRGISRRIQLGAIVEYPLPRSRSNVVRVMWRIDGAANVRGILLSPRLATAAQSNTSNLAMMLVYASFFGLAFALMVYNLALWGALRHRFQLAYCTMLALLAGYAFTSSGALAWVLPDIANNDRLRLNHLLLGCSAAAGVAFARDFFESHVFGPRLRIAVQVSIWSMVAASVLLALFAPVALHLFDRIYTITFLGMVGVVLAILWSAWRNRANFLRLFALAWIAPIIAASMRAFASLGLIGWSFWLDNSTILAMTAEALFSSVAIAYRIRLLSEERDQAVAAETVARRLAATDPLTGLLNRRSFLAEAIGKGGAQTLLILDLDHFKQVNETLGHDGGDEVLRIVARTLRTFAPPPDGLVARLGGEEFAMLVPTERPFDPNLLLARLRATRMPFDVRVTASIGAATGPLASEHDWKSLYRRADTALFAAKTAGRDRARAAPLAA